MPAFSLSLILGRRKGQISHQWQERSAKTDSGSFLFGAAEHQQPKLSHHAGSNHESTQHEAS